jgi:hypothetical protein
MLVAASAIKLRVKDCMIFHSSWKMVLHETKFICSPLLRAANNKVSDKQLNIALNLEAITVSKIFFKRYKQDINLHFHLLSLIKMTYNPKTTPYTSFGIEYYQSTNCF